MTGKISVPMSRFDIFRASRNHPDVVRAVQVHYPELLIYWDKWIGRWSIIRATPRGLFQVKTWANDDFSFKPMSMEVVKWLQRCDLWRQAESADKLEDEIRYDDATREAKVQSDIVDDIDHLTRSHRRQIQQLKDILGGLSGRHNGGPMEA